MLLCVRTRIAKRHLQKHGFTAKVNFAQHRDVVQERWTKPPHATTSTAACFCAIDNCCRGAFEDLDQPVAVCPWCCSAAALPKADLESPNSPYAPFPQIFQQVAPAVRHPPHR